MAGYSRALTNALINPSFGQGLFGVGQQAGDMLGGARGAREAEAEAIKQKELMAQKGLMSAYALGQNPGASDPTAALAAIQEGTGADAKQAIDLYGAAVDQRTATEKAKKEEEAKRQLGNVTAKYRTTLAETLISQGEASLASVVSNVPSLDMLPDKVQTMIYEKAGMTPVDIKEAKSPEGKLATDLGFMPGTEAFKEKVGVLVEQKKRSPSTTDQFDGIINGVSASKVDVAQMPKIADAIATLETSGLAGSDALQEQTLIDLFGSKPRAMAAVNNFRASGSLGRRISDTLSKWMRGETTELTQKDREDIVYIALRSQQAEVQSVVNNAADAVRAPEDARVAAQRLYGPSDATLRWQKKYEAKKQAEAKQETQQAVTSAKVGDVVNGHRYMGGPKTDPKSWSKE